MKLFYVPTQKKTGKPICVLDAPNFLNTSKGEGATWGNSQFIGAISGHADKITMEFIPDNKTQFGKSCVLTVENFQQKTIDTNKTESRNWFCKGNFPKGLEPIVVSDNKGANRQNVQKVIYENVDFELKLNNAISKEKSSGASTILRVFQ